MCINCKHAEILGYSLSCVSRLASVGHRRVPPARYTPEKTITTRQSHDGSASDSSSASGAAIKSHSPVIINSSNRTDVQQLYSKILSFCGLLVLYPVFKQAIGIIHYKCTFALLKSMNFTKSFESISNTMYKQTQTLSLSPST